jgi:cold-inducible RNA-binding protein
VSIKLYVGNLSSTTTEAELMNLFKTCGEVTSVKVMTDHETGNARGFGFVEFAKREEGEAAIKKLHGAELGGRTIVVNEARDAPGGDPHGGDRGPRGGDSSRRRGSGRSGDS